MKRKRKKKEKILFDMKWKEIKKKMYYFVSCVFFKKNERKDVEQFYYFTLQLKLF